MSNAAVSKSGTPGLRQFRQERCLSYVLYDASSGECVLLDPRADLMDEYREFIAERRLKPVEVVDSRLHWHHLSGSHLFAEAYGVPIAMSALTRSERVTRRLAHGDTIRAGGLELTVLSTPGVSPDAICLSGAGWLLSGDTIVAGQGARTDLPGGDPAALWRSLHEALGLLPGRTLVLPGCDPEELLFSTIEVEMKGAPDWKPPTAEALAQVKAEDRLARGEGDLKYRFDYNLRAHPAPSPESHFGSAPGGVARAARGVASISAEKCAHKLKSPSQDVCFLDVREAAEFRQGHVAGALNIPLPELAPRFFDLARFKRVYVSCASGSRSSLAARTLDYLGLPDVVHLSGGFRAWENAGLPVEKDN